LIEKSTLISSLNDMGSTSAVAGGTVFISILSTIPMLLFGKRLNTLLMLVILGASYFLPLILLLL
jgi:hypothetical protein